MASGSESGGQTDRTDRSDEPADAESLIRQCMDTKGALELRRTKVTRILKVAQSAELNEIAQLLGVAVTKLLSYDRSALRDSIVDNLVETFRRDNEKEISDNLERVQAAAAAAEAAKTARAAARAVSPIPIDATAAITIPVSARGSSSPKTDRSQKGGATSPRTDRPKQKDGTTCRADKPPLSPTKKTTASKASVKANVELEARVRELEARNKFLQSEHERQVKLFAGQKKSWHHEGAKSDEVLAEAYTTAMKDLVERLHTAERRSSGEGDAFFRNGASDRVRAAYEAAASLSGDELGHLMKWLVPMAEERVRGGRKSHAESSTGLQGDGGCHSSSTFDV